MRHYSGTRGERSRCGTTKAGRCGPVRAYLWSDDSARSLVADGARRTARAAIALRKFGARE